jgi:hypothetical protein
MGRIRLIVIAAVAAALSPLVTSEPAAAAHQPGASSPVVAADQVSAARQRASRHAEGLPFYDVRVASPTAANSASGQPAGVHVSRGMRAARAKLTRSLGRRGSVEVNPNTGTVRAMQRLNGTLTAPSGGRPATIAWSYVRDHAAALGLDDADLGAFHLSGRQVTPHGLTTLRWTDSYDGVPAFDNDLRVGVGRDGAIVNVLGSPLHDLSVPSITPTVSARGALRALAQNVGVNRPVRVVRRSHGVRRTTHFSTGDFARLVIFGGYGAPRLAWHLTYAAASTQNYDAVVDATTGSVLYRANLTKFADSHGTVWTNYPGASNGGTASAVDLTSATPESANGYLPADSTSLDGPNAHAFSDLNDDDLPQASEEVPNSSGADFNYPFTSFNSTATDGQCDATRLCSWDGDLGLGGTGDYQAPNSWQTNEHQNAVQAFWFVNNFHDHLANAAIGFGDSSGVNFHGASDKLLVNADDGANTGIGGPDVNHIDNANMTTLPVGQHPKMQMYLFNFDPNLAKFRDVNGGDDAAVVYHEYTHGLSSRLITNDDGTEAVDSAQTGAMGEAWSDWYAEDYLVDRGLVADDPHVDGQVYLGDYTDADPTANVTRTQPIDCPVGSTSSKCPGNTQLGGAITGGYTFGDFGRILGFPEVHADGEIWGETLWDLRAALIAHDPVNGDDQAEQIITDAMRLSPPEPSFLEERNAVLAAIQADFPSSAPTLTGIAWTVFAHRGMGFFAGTTDSSDVAPVQDTNPPPSGGGSGTIAGTVTSADTGLPISGMVVSLGGAGTPDGQSAFAATTNANGHYAIGNLPAGTYGVVATHPSPGFDGSRATHVAVTGGGTTTRNLHVRRDWAAAAGGATITATNDDSFASFECGVAEVNDQSTAFGWSAFNSTPGATTAGSPHPGVAPTVTVQLPQAITVRGFLADPSETCGDDPSAETKAYKIQTSPDGTSWTTASQGSFTAGQDHQSNLLTPTAGTTNVQFVRLTLLSPQDSTDPNLAGSVFVDFTELEVLGGPPNVLPTGHLAATPLTVKKGGTVHFDASSFTDPDSKITGYAWDFDGNGTTDRTTTSPTTSFTYNRAGTFVARVTAKDFVGGGTTASKKIVVTLPAKPTLTVAASGSRGRLKISFSCTSACHLLAVGKVTRAVRKADQLPSRTVGSKRASLSAAGKKSVRFSLNPATLKALRRHHHHGLRLTVKTTVTDANGQRTAVTRHVRIRI